MTEPMNPAEQIWCRDLDGTGSLHMCSQEQDGAIEFVPREDYDKMRQDAAHQCRERVKEWDRAEALQANNDLKAEHIDRWVNTAATQHQEIVELRLELAAMTEARDAAVARVKPLVWRHLGTVAATWVAQAPYGGYQIVDLGPNWDIDRYVLRIGSQRISAHSEEQSAKDAAQANLEQEISPFITPAQSDPLGAAWMREQAAEILRTEFRISHTNINGVEVFGCDAGTPAACYQIIRAIPDPTPADLVAQVLKLPEVAALVDAAMALHSDMLERAKVERDTNGNETGRIVSAGRSVWYDFDAALAALVQP